MWLWILVICLLLGLTIFGSIRLSDYGNDIWIIITAISTFGAIIMICALCSFTISAPNEIAIFEQQKEYIETHEPGNDIEDAALTNKKIELNKWLYEKQNYKNRFGYLYLYPETIMELEQIN